MPAATKAEREWFVKSISPAMYQTWSAIGGDLEEACAECNERLTNKGVVEACIDANRMQMYGGPTGKASDKLVTEAIGRYGYTKVLNFLNKNFKFV